MHIALLTLKETIEGEMNGETVEIGTDSIPQELAHEADEHDTGIVGHLPTIASVMKVAKEQTDLGVES